MYGGPLHNPAFIEAILNYLPDLDKDTYATTARIEGMLSTALEETIIQGDPEQAAAKQSTTAETPEQRTQTNETDTDNNAPPTRLVPRMNPAEQDRHPFFWFPSALAKVLHAQAPPEAAIKGALRHAGFRAVRSHAKPGAIRTDAPWAFVWEMMREWVRQKCPIKEDSIKVGQAGWKIMERVREGRMGEQGVEDGVEEDGEGDGGENVKKSAQGGEARIATATSSSSAPTPAKWSIVFDEQLGRVSDGRNKRLVRYQVNPRANWGPMVRAKK